MPDLFRKLTQWNRKFYEFFPRQWRALLFSATLSEVIKDLPRSIAEFIKIEYGISSIAVTTCLRIILIGFIYVLVLLAGYVVRFLIALIMFLSHCIGRSREFRQYQVIEKGEKEYQSFISKNIESSDKIYLMLVSGYTMFYDPAEKFILDRIKEKVKDKGKDFRILLLNPESQIFKERAEWFVQQNSEQEKKLKSAEDYIRTCFDIQEKLKKMGAKIRFYNIPPSWRIHLFDNCAFISSYEKERSGHETISYQINRIGDENMYKYFSNYFLSLWTEA